MLACASPGAAPASWQDLDAIRAAAEAYATAGPTVANAQVRAGELDPRLRLARCDGRLEAFRPPGARASGNTTVGVRCSGSQPWKLYVPVRVQATVAVLVARRALPRGAILGAADLETAERDITQLPYGYFAEATAVTGRQLRRALVAGQVLLPAMVAEAVLVRRGQTVTLEADASGVRIAMAGRALADGALDQRIRVENLSSGRTVEGVIRSAERVEVLLD